MGHARLKLLPNSFACSRALDKERGIYLKPLFEVSVEHPNIVQWFAFGVPLFLRIFWLRICVCRIVPFIVLLFCLAVVSLYLSSLGRLRFDFVFGRVVLFVAILWIGWWRLLFILASDHNEVSVFVWHAGVTCSRWWHWPICDFDARESGVELRNVC